MHLLRKLSGLVLFLLLAFSCEEDITPFPNVSINLTLAIDTDLENMTYNQFKLINGYGYGGVIIYRDAEGDFQAYDRACTYDYNEGCILEPHPDFNEIMECPCCGSSFWLSPNGQVYKGPAQRPLKQYTVYQLSGNMIKVLN